MKGVNYARFRHVPAALTLGLALCVAGGMSGGTCAVPGTDTNNNGNTNTPSPLPSLPPAVQPNSGGGTNIAPTLTFGWPTAPLTIQSGAIVTIQWTVSDPEDSARVSISARNSLGADIVLASGVPGIAPQSSHSFVWNTGIVTPGTYRVVALVSDSNNNPVSIIAPGDITITARPPNQNPPPPPPTPPNTPPSIVFSNPVIDRTVDAGTSTSIDWTTQDFEDAINLKIFADSDTNDTNTNEITLLNTNVNASTAGVPGSVTWVTSVAPGTYRIIGQVDDNTGAPGHVVRRDAAGKIIVIPSGTGTQNGAPTVTPALPVADVGLSQGDQLVIAFLLRDPDAQANGTTKDSITVTVYFDRDIDPTNDAVDPPIEVDMANFAAGSFPANTDAALVAVYDIDTTITPVREETDEGGNPLPYFIRIKADDGKGGIVNSYTVGRARVLGAANDVVDLQTVGGTVSGVRFQGFNGGPFVADEARGSRAGSAFSKMGDVDGDLIGDFAIAAQTATPQNRTNVGAAYLIYGRDRTINTAFDGRYAGVVSLNTVGTFVDFPPTDPNYETIFKIRGTQIYMQATQGPTDGISALAAWPDISGDGTPELLVGTRLTGPVVDFEDDDPCDTCTFPDPPDPNTRGIFQCMIDPQVVVSTGNVTFPTQLVNANQWVGANGIPDSPDNPPPLVPNVDLMFTDERVIDNGMGALQLDISGSVIGATPNNPTQPVTLTVQLEYNVNTGVANPNPPPNNFVIEGPQVTSNFTVSTDANGDATFTSTVLFQPHTPFQMPTATTNPPPAPNSEPVDGEIPVSAWDGKFNVLVRPSVNCTFTTLDVTFTAIMATLEEHSKALHYFDFRPNERSRVTGCDSTTPAPIDPVGASQLPAAIAPFNDDRFSDSNTSGYLCNDPLVASLLGGTGAADGDDDIWTGSPDASEFYQTGIVYICAGDSMVLRQFVSGQWAGLRTANIAGFGSGPEADNFVGGRFRGAWWNSGGFFDPLSRFGETIDTMPDLVDPNGTTGLQELIVSAPGAAVSATGFNNMTTLTGAFTAGQARTSTYVLKQSLQAGAPDVIFPIFRSVFGATLHVTGTATRGARLRLEIAGAQVNTQRDISLWPGDTNFNGDQDFAEFYNATMPFDVQMVLPRAALPLLLNTGVGNTSATLSLSFIDPVNGTYFPGFRRDPGPVDTATMTVNVAELTITGTMPDVGEITLFEGRNWTSDVSGAGNDSDGGTRASMSWPAAQCTPNLGRRWDPNIPGSPRLIVTQLQGQKFSDFFGWAHNAGDVNQDGEFDIACGAPGSDNNPFNALLAFGVPGVAGTLNNNGKSFVVYGTPVLPDGAIGPPIERIEIRGTHDNDALGTVQGLAGDFGGDTIADAYVGCANYDNDGQISGIAQTGTDAGFAAVLFGSTTLTGEKVIRMEQIGTGNFRGCKFIGGTAGARLGDAISSAGDFNLDGKEDILITAPGQVWPGAKVVFKGPVLNGDRVTINGNIFEFDTDGTITAGNIMVDVSGVDALGALRTLPASSEAALRKAMRGIASDVLGVSSVLSRTKFPPPETNDPTTIFLARRPNVFSATTTSANITVTNFQRQGACYLLFGAGGNTLVNKTFVLPDDLNRVVGTSRILKGLAFVGAYDRNDPRDLSLGVDSAGMTINFETGGVQLADAAPYITVTGGSEQVIANASLLSSGTQGYRVVAGTDAVITFPKSACQLRAYFAFDPASGATGATLTALDADGFPVASVDANTSNGFGDNDNFVDLGSTSLIKTVVIHVNGPANSAAAIDDLVIFDPSPDEGPVEAVSAIGDIDNDGFPDVILGAPRADFINILEPCNRRRSAGEAYIVYGNNFGLNDSLNP